MITGPSSFVWTTQEVITHWTAVNAFLAGAGPLLVPDPVDASSAGISLAAFSAKRVSLLAKRDVVEEVDVERALGRAELNLKKEWLHLRLNLLNEGIRGRVPLSSFARSLEDVPGIEAGLDAFTSPMKKSRYLWSRLNADPPSPLTGGLILSDGTELSDFTTAVGELGTLWDAVTGWEKDLEVSLQERNDVQDVLYSWMKGYRTAARAALPRGNALLDSLPRLTPDGGRTPDGVELNGAFDAVNNAADLDWTESLDEDLIEYEVRVTYGPDYDGENDHIVANIAKGQPRVLKTTKGLQVPGAVASYKAFVRIKGGGEAGSNAVSVERPVP